MSNFVFTDADGNTLTSMSFGQIVPGRSYTKKLGLKNVSDNDYNDILLSFFPNMVSGVFSNTDGVPIVSADIIKMTSAEVIQKVDVDEEDEDGLLTALTSYRGKCFEYDDSVTATWTDYSTGNVTFPNTTDKYFYIGSDEIFFNISMVFSTPGVYSSVTYEYWNGSAWTALPGDASDGTSELTLDGTLYLGSLESLWEKRILDDVDTSTNRKMYWIRITVTGITTAAVASSLYWDLIWEAPYKFWYGNDYIIYEMTDDVTTLWNVKTPDTALASQGKFAFKTNPLSDPNNHELRANYSYKIPQDGEYDFTFPSTVTCSVNEEDAVTVVSDGTTQNTNMIEGMTIVLISTLTTDDEATIEIDDSLAYIWFADVDGDSPGTWQNEDYDLGTIESGDTTYFYMKIEPPVSKSTSDNTPYFKPYALGDVS